MRWGRFYRLIPIDPECNCIYHSKREAMEKCRKEVDLKMLNFELWSNVTITQEIQVVFRKWQRKCLYHLLNQSQIICPESIFTLHQRHCFSIYSFENGDWTNFCHFKPSRLTVVYYTNWTYLMLIGNVF